MNNRNSGNGMLVIVVIIFAVIYMVACPSGQSEYSKLSPREKQNAKWAYEVQQEINRRK